MGPSEYFLKRKHLWLDKNFKSTTDWDKAEFLFEAGEYVRINKGKTWQQIQDEIDLQHGFY